MWYKVRQLHETGLTKSQIRYETGLDRKTIRRYLSLSEKGFHEWISKRNNIPRKLSGYYQFVRKTLEDQPYLSSPQIEDKLKESYPDMPEVHSKTIHNFVRNIRQQHKLPKVSEKKPREYIQLPERPYGEEAQVDFGQALMRAEWGTAYSVRIYFFVMVLSRSRYKFVYCQDRPFTTATAVYAHELAFEYFQGVPKKIIYDQDRVFISEENLGDVVLTEGFRSYCNSLSFEPVFCRRADPESKGKVENVVKYVKYNFLRGRAFHSIHRLQGECLGWLERRGNGKLHGTTLKVPRNEWLVEKEHLQPRPVPVIPAAPMSAYSVRKDNTVRYRGNHYSLPCGTHKGPDSKVLLEAKGSVLCLYNAEKQLLAQHIISEERGRTISCESHRKRDTSVRQEQTYREVQRLLGPGKGEYYLELLKANKSRYYYSNLKVMGRSLADVPGDIVARALDTCLENSIYNGHEFTQVLFSYLREDGQPLLMPTGAPKGRKNVFPTAEMTPAISNISFYESILE